MMDNIAVKCRAFQSYRLRAAPVVCPLGAPIKPRNTCHTARVSLTFIHAVTAIVALYLIHGTLACFHYLRICIKYFAEAAWGYGIMVLDRRAVK